MKFVQSIGKGLSKPVDNGQPGRQLRAGWTKMAYAVDLAAPYLSVYCGHESLLESEKYMKFSSEMFDEEMEAFSKFSGQLFPEVGL